MIYPVVQKLLNKGALFCFFTCFHQNKGWNRTCPRVSISKVGAGTLTQFNTPSSNLIPRRRVFYSA